MNIIPKKWTKAIKWAQMSTSKIYNNKKAKLAHLTPLVNMHKIKSFNQKICSQRSMFNWIRMKKL